MSLKKGTKMLDAEGLDAIHDQVREIMSTRGQTATWNRSRDAFLCKVNEKSKNRLLRALNEVLATMKYCIKSANEFQIV